MAGVAENFRSSSTLLKIGAILIVIAFIAHVVCFSIPHWMVLNSSINDVIDDIFDEYKVKVHTGLWKLCSCASVLGYEQCACLDWPIVPSWLAGVRAALTVGLILLIVSTGAVLIQLFCKKDKRLQIAGVVGAAAAGFSLVVGIAMYVLFIPKEYEFKFCIWICGVAALACWISTAFLIGDRKQHPSTPPSDQPAMLFHNCPTHAGQPAQPGDMKSIQYAQAPMQQPQQPYVQQQPPPYSETTGQYGQQSGQYGHQPGQQLSPSGQYIQQPGQQVPV